MNIYNPFRPHITYLKSGGYVVRKLGVLGWQYLESKAGDEVWRSTAKDVWMYFYSARKRLDAYNASFSKRVK